MSGSARARWPHLLAKVKPKDRNELALLLGGIVFLLLLFTASKLANEVLEGDTQEFDKRVLVALRDPADPLRPIGPSWLVGAALDMTALGSATVLGLTVFAIGGFLLLQGMWRRALFVTLASFGGMSLDHDTLDRVSVEWRQRADIG